jgi:hypothetical protein
MGVRSLLHTRGSQSLTDAAFDQASMAAVAPPSYVDCDDDRVHRKYMNLSQGRMNATNALRSGGGLINPAMV